MVGTMTTLKDTIIGQAINSLVTSFQAIWYRKEIKETEEDVIKLAGELSGEELERIVTNALSTEEKIRLEQVKIQKRVDRKT
jgi:hypothetical protein